MKNVLFMYHYNIYTAIFQEQITARKKKFKIGNSMS